MAKCRVGNVFLLPTIDGVTYFGAGKTKRRLVGNKKRLVGNKRRLVGNKKTLVGNKRRLVGNKKTLPTLRTNKPSRFPKP